VIFVIFAAIHLWLRLAALCISRFKNNSLGGIWVKPPPLASWRRNGQIGAVTVISNE
jgi:hypothetical protein